MISVVVPTWNRAFFLSEALDSIAAQTLRPKDVWVIDDGSTDQTSALVQSRFPQFHYVYQDNQGVASARNAGIARASGEWIAFLDSDDLWLPNKLEAQWNYLQTEPDCRVLQTEEIWFRNNRRVNPKKKHAKKSGFIFKESVALCLVSPSAVMIHREVFEKVGLFDPAMQVCEDYDLWLRIALHTPIHCHPKPLTIKRNRQGTPQLSEFPCQDRYRVMALEKLLASGKLNYEQEKIVRYDLERRQHILEQGRLKRNQQDKSNS